MDGERFELIGELGRGGMGRVYRVLDRQAGVEVALKTLKSPNPRDLYRFKREFRSVAELSHPNLIKLYELFEVDGEWMYTMELIDGVPFHVGVRPRVHDPLDVGRLVDATAQLTDALCALHASGTIHRDLKPSNVLREPGGRVVVLDFGLASDPDIVDRTHDRMAVGTPAYMSPEQARDEGLSPASDWYGVGVMLYECLTGRRPFEGASSAILALKQDREPLPPGSLAADIPRVLEDLCLQLLQRDPAARPDGAAILAALGRTTSSATRLIVANAAPRPLHNREAELARLWSALRDSRGRPVLALVRGPDGSGKSALLAAFGAEARDTGALVFEARATTREALPFRALDQLVDQLATYLLGLAPEHAARLLPPDVAMLAKVFPTLKRIPAARLVPTGDVPELAEVRRRALAAVSQLFGNLAREGPVVVLLDDIHHAAEPGWRVMNDHVEGEHGPGVLFVGAHDDTESPVLANLRAWDGDLRILDLAPWEP